MISSHDENFIEVKIADFGLAEHFKPSTILTLRCGSPGNFAPEIIRGSAYD